MQTPGAVGQSASWPSGIKGDVNQALVSLCCLGLLCFYLVVVVVVTFVLLVIGYKDPFFCTSQATGWVDHL